MIYISTFLEFSGILSIISLFFKPILLMTFFPFDITVCIEAHSVSAWGMPPGTCRSKRVNDFLLFINLDFRDSPCIT